MIWRIQRVMYMYTHERIYSHEHTHVADPI